MCVSFWFEVFVSVHTDPAEYGEMESKTSCVYTEPEETPHYDLFMKWGIYYGRPLDIFCEHF